MASSACGYVNNGVLNGEAFEVIDIVYRFFYYFFVSFFFFVTVYQSFSAEK